MILRYALIAALAGVMVLAGLLYRETARRAAVEADLRTEKILHGACEARRANLSEDKESDNAIDRIPDADLRRVPDRWLRPEGGAGGGD